MTMKNKIIYIIAISISLFFSPFYAVCETDNTILLRDLYSNDLDIRTIALINLNNNDAQLSLQFIDAVLHLAKKENETKESLSAGESGEEYMSQLIIALGKTRDRRAVKYLIDEIGSGTLAARSLAEIGEPSIVPLITELNNELDGVRFVAAQAIVICLEHKIDIKDLNKEIYQKLKVSLVEELQQKRNQEPSVDENYYKNKSEAKAEIRQKIIEALGYIVSNQDYEVINILKMIAKDDSYYSESTKSYTVRNAAKSVLERLKSGS